MKLSLNFTPLNLKYFWLSKLEIRKRYFKVLFFFFYLPKTKFCIKFEKKLPKSPKKNAVRLPSHVVNFNFRLLYVLNQINRNKFFWTFELSNFYEDKPWSLKFGIHLFLWQMTYTNGYNQVFSNDKNHKNYFTVSCLWWQSMVLGGDELIALYSWFLKWNMINLFKEIILFMIIK